MNDAPNPSWQDQPPYNPSDNGEQDGSWYAGEGGGEGSEGGSGEDTGGNPPSPPALPVADAMYPLYGAALGSLQFGAPTGLWP